MAALSDKVTAARSEAAQLRSAAVALRITAQQIAWENNRRRAACDSARKREGFRFQSAWSELRWRPPAQEFDHVLVAVASSGE